MVEKKVIVSHVLKAYEEAVSLHSFKFFLETVIDGFPVELVEDPESRMLLGITHSGSSWLFDDIGLRSIEDGLALRSLLLPELMHNLVCDFCSWWRYDKEELEQLGITNFSFVDSKEDFFMKKEEGSTTVIFNYNLVGITGLTNFKTIIVHEVNHLIRHNLPNKSDVQSMQDAFGSITMEMMDVEADLVTASYLREKAGFTLEDFYSSLYDGQKIFRSARIRPHKLERFIGSILSIYELYMHNEESTIIPSIQSVYLENNMKIFTNTADHFNFQDIPFDISELECVKTAYNTGHITMTREEYVLTLKNFASYFFDQYSLIQIEVRRPRRKFRY